MLGPMAARESSSRAGLTDSLRRLAATLVALTHTRLQILSIDLGEGRERLVGLLALLFATLLTLGIGVVLATIALVLASDTSNQLRVLAAAAGSYLLLGAALLAFTLRRMRALPPLLNTSLSELDKDRELFAKHS